MRTVLVSLLTTILATTLGAGSVSAQSQTVRIRYLNSQGSVISGWKLGETITIEVTGGNPTLKCVQVLWQSGGAGANGNMIAQNNNYNYASGCRFTVNTASLTSATSITTLIKTGPSYSNWFALASIWRRS